MFTFFSFLFADLDLRVASLVSNGLASSSRRTYSKAVSKFIDFCSRFSLDPRRCDETTILRFIAHLASTSTSSSTVKVYLSGIRAWVISMGLPPLTFIARELTGPLGP